MSRDTDKSGTATASPAEILLGRMRDGDRDAAAEFVRCYGELIRIRVREKLGISVRRVLDSEDVLSTVARRLDGIVYRRRLRAGTQAELWSLVTSIANHAVCENVRVCERERTAASARDQEVMASSASSGDPESRGTDDGSVSRALRAVGNDTDRRILWLRLLDRHHSQIAASIGSTPAAVRMRWHRIKETLRAIPDPDRA